MKFMILLYGSQRDYEMLSGQPNEQGHWSAADIEAVHAFMARWNQRMVDSGEFVDAAGLSAPAQARSVSLRDGTPVVTEGPHAATQEVLAGYNMVECESFDRATELAAQLAEAPHPENTRLSNAWHVDIRPIAGPSEPMAA